MKTATATTMDLAGRLVIPKAIRDAAELQPGVRLVFEVVDGRIVDEETGPQFAALREAR